MIPPAVPVKWSWKFDEPLKSMAVETLDSMTVNCSM
jgi:hypothetical protein